MQLTFTVNDASCCLEARIDGQAHPLLTPTFARVDQRDEALGYLRGVAERLNTYQSAGRSDQLAALLADAHQHLHQSGRTDYGRRLAIFKALLR
jgi:hypothetical protein